MNSKLEKCLFNISKYRTQLMGIAAFWVLAHHMFTELYTTVSIPIVTQIFARGNIGVDMFLVVSGMGLYVSITKRNNVMEFYQKRIIKVIIPWLLMSIPYWIFIYILQENSDFIDFFKDLLGISFWTEGVSTTWYVEFVIILYLLYPFIYKVQNRNLTYVNFMIIIAVLINFLIYLFFPSWYIKVDKALTRVPVFLLGSIVGQLLFGKEKKEECKNILAIYMIMAILAFIVSPFIKRINHEFGVIFYFLGACGIAFVIMLFLSWMLDIKKWELLNMVLVFGGKMSLEVYLLNVFIRNIMVEFDIGMKSSDSSKICSMVLASFFIIMISYIWYKFNTMISTVIEGKLKK